MKTQKKIAIVYDWLDKWGGVERILLIFREIFPQADFFSSYYNSKTASWAKVLNPKTSFIQKLPNFIKNSRFLSLPFYPFAFESFDFSDYQVVISITSSFAKAIITRPGTKHICYLLTPTRFLWSHYKDYFSNNIFNLFLGFYINYLKKWDKIVSFRPDKIISISKTVANRCNKYYHRESQVIYPPFDIDYWQKIKKEILREIVNENKRLNKLPKFKFNINEKFFLIVSRLEPYKKIELVIEAFNKRKENLVIVGEGSLENNLKKMVKKNNIFFLKKLTDKDLGFLYSFAQALIMPQEEDFGYVALESQFFSCPLISCNKGGVSELIRDKKTGLFFHKQTPEEIFFVIERFYKIKYNLETNLKNQKKEFFEKFDKKNFIKKFTQLIN